MKLFWFTIALIDIQLRELVKIHRTINHKGYILLYVNKYTSVNVTCFKCTTSQAIKNPPAVQETWVRSLGWEDPLEKERPPTPVFWPGEFHGLYSPRGSKELDMTERLPLYSDIHTHTCIYTGNYLEESLKAGVCLKNCNQGL